jgi:hypothetical protein
MWQSLKIDAVKVLIFAMVANRALALSSKLGMEHLVNEDILKGYIF